MTDIIVYLILFTLLGTMMMGSDELRYFSLFAGLVIFPLGVGFIQSPTLRPMDLFLYGFLAIEFVKNFSRFKEDFFSFPLLVPLGIVLLFHYFTIFYNDGLKVKEYYAGTREFIELYAFIFAAYISGKYANYQKIIKALAFFTLGLCILGIIEVALSGNYPYTYICRAFPKYSGYYNLEGIVSMIQDWRIRTMITTAHPTALGTLLLSLTIVVAMMWNKKILKNHLEKVILVLLFLNLFLCGSRTAMLCTVIGIGFIFLHKMNIVFKIFFIGGTFFAVLFSINLMVEQVSQEGHGSSLSLRGQQLLFTLVQVENSPILGNGVGATKDVFEYNDEGRVINDEEIGGLESAVFRTLIDYGFLGLFGYYFIFVWLFVYFFKKRVLSTVAITGYTLVVVNALFFTLSGHIGNNTAFAFLLIGLCMGNLKAISDKPQDESQNERSHDILV